jgi:glucokinase
VELVRDFLGGDPPPISVMCLGVAGPVKSGRAVVTNLPWSVALEELEGLGLGRVFLINDLLATAWGVTELAEEGLADLNRGTDHRDGNAALIAAGTGLGQSLLFWDGEKRIPSASEGGHSDFAPLSEIEIELLQYLNREYGRASFERVLSGPGLQNVYRFLVETGRGEERGEAAERMQTEDPAAVIAEVGMAGSDPVCAQALDIFVHVYGAEAGNLALKALATAGVYVGGGIAPKILRKLQEGPFMQAFADKGRLSGLLRDIPVRVILDPKTALYGCARYAVLQAKS